VSVRAPAYIEDRGAKTGTSMHHTRFRHPRSPAGRPLSVSSRPRSDPCRVGPSRPPSCHCAASYPAPPASTHARTNRPFLPATRTTPPTPPRRVRLRCRRGTEQVPAIVAKVQSWWSPNPIRRLATLAEAERSAGSVVQRQDGASVSRQDGLGLPPPAGKGGLVQRLVACRSTSTQVRMPGARRVAAIQPN